jgi:hypothetical protein
MNDIQVILQTTNYAEMHRALDALEANDIPCIRRNVDTPDFSGLGQLASGINPAFGMYEVCVSKEDAAKAAALLHEILPDVQPPRTIDDASPKKKNPKDKIN